MFLYVARRASDDRCANCRFSTTAGLDMAGCANKIPLGLSTWMNRILKTGTAVGRGTAGVRLGTESCTGD
eukprot:g412.t1